MSFINFILDIAALLLWLSWRSLPFDPLARATPATLAGTVRRAEPTRFRRWHFLAVLLGLLLVRSIFYWQIGPAVNWTPRFDLGIVALPFRCDVFITAGLFSLFSFGRTWMIFHFWLLALVVINGRAAERDPVQKMILLQLGWIARWPRFLQATLPAWFTVALWMTVHPLLVRVGMVNRVQSIVPLFEQGALLGTALYFTLKHLLPILLLLYLIGSYVYLGASPLWDYVSASSRKVLAPLNRLPLRYGKIDFAPLAGIVLILLLLHALPNLLLGQLDRRHLALWPQ